MQSQLKEAHLQLQARFERLRERLAFAASDDERSQIHNDLLLLSDELSALMKSRPQWDGQKH